jgi:hypothetical protein
MRILESDAVAQCVKQRHVGVGIDGMRLAIDIEAEFLAHDVAP